MAKRNQRDPSNKDRAISQHRFTAWSQTDVNWNAKTAGKRLKNRDPRISNRLPGVPAARLEPITRKTGGGLLKLIRCLRNVLAGIANLSLTRWLSNIQMVMQRFRLAYPFPISVAHHANLITRQLRNWSRGIYTVMLNWFPSSTPSELLEWN